MKYKVRKCLFIIVFVCCCFFSLAKYVSANNNKGVVSIFYLDNDSRQYISGIKYNIYNGYNQDGKCSGKIIASKVSSYTEQKIELDNGIYCIETLSNDSYHISDTKEVEISSIIDKELPIVLAKKTSNNKGVGSVSIFDHLQSTISAHADYLPGVTYDIYRSSGNCLSRYEKVISGVKTDSYYNSFELDMNKEYCAVITAMPNNYLPSLSSYEYAGGIGYSFYVDSTPYSNEALIGTMKKRI